MIAAMSTTPRAPDDGVDTEIEDVENDFELDVPTPVVSATGTRDDLVEKARAAQRLATEPGSLDDDVASLAHDLKNPLTVIMLETTQIEQRLGAHATPAVLRGLERIAQNAAYVDRLVSDLLDVASADAGRLELRLDRIDLAALVRSAAERAVASPDRARLRLEIRDGVFAWADEMRIERVLANLVTNAFKYCPDGLVSIRLETRGGYSCVSVIDRGPGLSADEAKRVFERYRRGTAGNAHGYGLGLYTSRKIVEAHRGRIGCVSKPGHGARFYFELPLASAA
jgi:signal transduction histidine kinase